MWKQLFDGCEEVKCLQGSTDKSIHNSEFIHTTSQRYFTFVEFFNDGIIF